MKAVTTDYSNRQVDIEMLQTVVMPSGIQQLVFSVASLPTKAVTGMQKLVQRYTLALLTMLGDVHFDLTFGTTFWTDMLHGAMQNAGQVETVVAFANSDAVALLKQDDNDPAYGSIPADEQIDNAVLSDFNVDTNTGTLYLKIVLTNQQGTDYTYVLPISLIRS